MFHSARNRSAVVALTLVAASLNLLAIPAQAAGEPGTPAAPTIGTAARGNGSATVTWTAPADISITGYLVTSTPGALTAPAPPLGTSATVTGLTNGTSYTFTVHATNAIGDSFESASSNPVTPATVPGAPAIGTATRGNGSATVAWNAPVDGGSSITGYTVTPSTGPTTTVAGAALTANVTGLTNGTAYTFTVHATNSVGNGAESSSSNSVIPATVPGPPTIGAATRGNGSATIAWTAPAVTGGAAITGYTVTPSGGLIATITVGGTTLSAPVAGLANGTAYTFTVHATNALGNGAESASSNLVIPATIPGAPTIGTATRGNGSAAVTWTAPADGGSAITGYTVTPSTGPTTTVAGGALIANVPGLTNGTAYTFTVHATNSAGNGAESASSNSVTPVAVPGAPTIGTASAGDASATVTWSGPVVTGGSAIISYTVTPSGGPIAAVTVNGSTFSATLTGLTNGTPYTFTVTASNSLGAGLASSASAAVTPGGPPDPKIVPAAARSGYWMVGSDGVVYAFGDAKWLGNAATTTAVDLEPTPSGNGYWIVDDVGRISTFGDAVFYPRVQSKLVAGEKVTSLSATRSGGGYWIFTSKGRVLTFGDAQFFGDVASTTLNGPVLDSIITPSGKGYFLVASDGGIFAFGDALFHGSMGGQHLNAPVQSLVPDSDGVGYWLVAGDGGIFAFDAAFKGSMGSVRLNRPITGMVRAGDGYLMVGEDGGIFDFSGTIGSFKGSLGATPPARPIVSVAALEN